MHCRIRMIQSEIHAVQFFDHPLPSDTNSYDSWVHRTADQVQRLTNEIAADLSAPFWLISAAYQCQVLLFRPCSRNITVSESSLLNVVRALVQLIDSYTKSTQAGDATLTFELANSSFQAGMVLLYALRNRADELADAFLTATVEQTLEALDQLLVGLSRCT